MQLEGPFHGLPAVNDTAQSMAWNMGMANWQDFQTAISFSDSLPRLPSHGLGSLGSNSPTGTYLEVLSLNSGSDNESGWANVNMFPSYEYQPTPAQNTAIFNSSQTLTCAGFVQAVHTSSRRVR